MNKMEKEMARKKLLGQIQMRGTGITREESKMLEDLMPAWDEDLPTNEDREYDNPPCHGYYY